MLVFQTPIVLIGAGAIVTVFTLIIMAFKPRPFVTFLLCTIACLCGLGVDHFAKPQIQVSITTTQPKPSYIIGMLDHSASETALLERGTAIDAVNHQDWWRYTVTMNGFIDFAKQRPFDRIAATIFDDKPKIISRLRQRDATSNTIQELPKVAEPKDGTEFVPAFKSVVNQFEQDSPADANRILIIGSDGEQNINAADASAIVADLLRLHVHVYWVQATDELMVSEAEQPHVATRDLTRLVKEVKGTIYRRTTIKDVKLAYQELSLALPMVDMDVTTVKSVSLFGFCGLAVLIVCAFIAVIAGFCHSRQVLIAQLKSEITRRVLGEVEANSGEAAESDGDASRKSGVDEVLM